MKKLYFFAASLLMALLVAQGGYAQCNTCTLSGPSSILQGQTGTYSTATLSGASYFWSATGGLSVQGSATSSSATIKANTVGTGRVCVTRYKAGAEPCSNCRTITITSTACTEPTSVSVFQGLEAVVVPVSMSFGYAGSIGQCWWHIHVDYPRGQYYIWSRHQ